MTDLFPPITLDELARLDAQDVLVLTVNNRHARRILAELSSSLTEGRSVMAVPDIVPLSGWLRRAADQLSFVPESGLASHTLDAFGAQWLWKKVIAEAESERALLDVSQAARLAAEADRLIDDWRIQLSPEMETSDYQHFLDWRERYRQQLAQLDMEDANLAYACIDQAVRSGLLQAPAATVVLAGFNELSPRLSGMLLALQEQGVNLAVLSTPAVTADTVQRVVAPDPDGEWRLAIQWAAEQLQAHPQGRYAIVAARLEADVVLAHRCLRGGLVDGQGKVLPYNVAVARPMSEWPLVAAAMSWLRVLAGFVVRKTCAPVDLGPALLAGACAAARQEASGRAVIDALWRRRAVIGVSEPAFVQLLDQYAPQLALAWSESHALMSGQSDSATVDVWVQRFRQGLQALGYPGQAVLDSHAFQQLEAFDGLMDSLARQARVMGKVGMSTAVGLLQRLAHETPFQPQRDPAARLDVLGFLESEGGRWDGVWVLGLTDEVLPAAPKPNPFIPLAALRQARAPRATPERELHWARTLYQSLLASAPQVWLSHAEYEGERELRPSPCIVNIDASTGVLQVQEPRPIGLECIRDEQGPPLQTGATTRGGIAVIDTQARNPLWAFAKYRLGASALADYAQLSDQNARGLLLHKAIELVWRMLADQQALRELLAQGGVLDLLEQSVQQAAAECLQDYGTMVRQLETDRTVAVLQRWLDLELAREPFSVRDVEQTYSWSHGALQLSLRLDRIDELADGRLAVIDYKSGGGRIDPKPDWMRERPVGLQLPFYASVLAQDDARVAALVLARLHAREVQVKGLADADYGFDGLAALADWPAFAGYSWDELMGEWRRIICLMADEYAAGVARNHSLRPDDIQYCDVLPFLRLNEEYHRVD
ncbi:PD-(D/E)XK nuclease family protein [Alcaligenaceae bacterium]|nr:PD-(D/E)XK nuclease family protein [Alcaligenaceae bacterium]